jgi:hypothetical protein
MSTPEGVRDALDEDLLDRQPYLQRMEDYYEGRHLLAFASSKFRSAFGSMFTSFSDNWCGLIVDSAEERLNVEGFRMGSAGASADTDAWRIWQTNGLDLDSQMAHTDAMIYGSSYVTVWAGDDPSTPAITVESPRQVIVRYAAGSRRTRIAAWKRWIDDDGYAYGTLYLPDAIYKYRSSSTVPLLTVSALRKDILTPPQRTSWVPRPGEEEPIANPLGVVPVVEIRNLPRVLGHGRSEIEQIIPIQDATNKLVADMLVAAEYSAFKQRWVTGLDIPTDDNGNAIEPFKAAVDRLWISENPDTRFGEFQQTDLGGYVRSVEMFVQHAATISRTPPHYFLLNGGQAPSGEAITSAEAGLVAKCKRKMRSFEESWEEVMRLAFAVLGDNERATAYDAEVLWSNPAYRSEAALVDALLKLSSLGVPKTQLWADAGYSPQQIERFRTEASMNALFDAAATGLDAEIPPPVFGAPDEV